MSATARPSSPWSTSSGIIRLHYRLHWARSTILLSLAVIAYIVQGYYGVYLLIHPHNTNSVNNISYVLFATLVISLQRAWSLLEGKHIAVAKAESHGRSGATHAALGRARIGWRRRGAAS